MGEERTLIPARQKVLVVANDTAEARSRLRDLEGLGLQVLSAPDAINALAAARVGQPDALVINSELAGGGGLVALKRIRSNVFTANIPVVAIASKGREREFMDAGAQECVGLKASPQDIFAAVQRHMLKSLDFTAPPTDVVAAPERLAALHAAGLLDSPPEEAFDRLTRLAAKLLGVSTALVSLVDKDRQFFKSQVGLSEPWATIRQTRLSHSFCQWVVAGEEPLVVKDAKQNSALRSNLAIKELGVIAYAGVPLCGRGGEAIGSFCAIESAPREWSEEDLATLTSLAHVCEAYAALHRAQAAKGLPSTPALENIDVSMHVAGKSVIGVARILKLYGERLGTREREDLLAILEEQSNHLLALGAERA